MRSEIGKKTEKLAAISLDPFGLVVDVFNDIYPNTACKIEFVEGLKSAEHGAWGCTVFSDDGAEPVVSVDVALTIMDGVEVLAHELAHVAVGACCGEDHGEDWEKAFSAIHEEYCARVARKAEAPDA